MKIFTFIIKGYLLFIVFKFIKNSTKIYKIYNITFKVKKLLILKKFV